MTRTILAGFLIICGSFFSLAQTTISWYAFDSGFIRGKVGSGGSIVGQPLAGRIGNSNFQIESGFAVNDTIKGVISEISTTSSVPHDFQLYQNFPNPFNPRTSIQYDLPFSSHVSLKVYDVLGRIVAILVEEEREQGRHISLFEASRFSSGIYIYQLVAIGKDGEQFISRKKMLLVK